MYPRCLAHNNSQGILVLSPLTFHSERSDMKEGEGRGGSEAKAKIRLSCWEMYFHQG